MLFPALLLANIVWQTACTAQVNTQPMKGSKQWHGSSIKTTAILNLEVAGHAQMH